MRVDGEYTTHSEIRVYQAHKGTASARLVCESLFSDGTLTIQEREIIWNVKLNAQEIISLASVFRQWEADQLKDTTKKI